MFGFEAEGAAALVKGEPIENPETVATAIRIGNPASWNLALNARDESEGHIDLVTDEEILEAYRKLASTEGIFAEPASAASLAGVMKMRKLGRIAAGKQVVCVLTGNGLKDPNIALKSVGVEPVVVESTEEAVVGIITQGAGV
jgi:threonine synthase